VNINIKLEDKNKLKVEVDKDGKTETYLPEIFKNQSKQSPSKIRNF
jgi:hypothetical protein